MSKEEQLEHINTFFDVDVKTKEMISFIKSLERFRMFLYKDAADHVNLMETVNLNDKYIDKLQGLLKDTWTSEYDGKRIKIYVPDIPPTVYIKTKNEAVGYFMELWKEKTKKSLLKYKLSFKQVFIWIKLFNPVSFDTDNKFIKPFIDGLVRSSIIQDDNNNIVKYGVEGHVDIKNPHMEIFVFGDENIPDFIKQGIS
ncbi:MAG: hypothetical protein LKF87_10075 [Clostridium tyrobutyricum]|jgi:hypothetical protein|uniref:hypothetical protein n=1 Tax=Clostridium tyrobutyricum TaxID=1519 RepID=UPI00242C0309|nr:hypothetical protein [Clostridium tyrobutyricum]MCH4201321.1 hypothetical protein [Clostridium tyrobutyricum]MCH4259296.1 hypothetical protein [Clostridium tyrobutyricum]